jgi:hypothetical protein
MSKKLISNQQSSTVFDLSTMTNVRGQIGAIALALNPQPITDIRERRRVQAQARSVPSKLVSGVAAVAGEHGGALMGIPVDAKATQSTLSYVEAGLGIVTQLRALATVLEEEMWTQRASVTDPALAAYNAIRIARRTAVGKALYMELAALKALRPSSSRKASGEPATPPAPSPAPVVQPSK